MAATLWVHPFEPGVVNGQALARPAVAVSRLPAAGLFGLDGFPRAGVEIPTVRNISRLPPGVAFHRVRSLTADDVVVRHGIPVTAPARLLLDLAAVLPPARRERAVDEVLRLGLASRLGISWAAEHSKVPRRVALRRLMAERMRG